MAEEIKKSAKTQIEEEGEKVFMAVEVEKYHRKNPEKHDKRILVIGEFRGIYYHITSKLDKRKIFHWIDLKRIELDRENKIARLEFRDREAEKRATEAEEKARAEAKAKANADVKDVKKEAKPQLPLIPMKFKVDNVEAIIKTIANHIVRTMPAPAIEHLGIKQFSTVEKRDVPIAARCRLRAFEKLLEKKLPPHAVQIFENAIKYRHSTISIPSDIPTDVASMMMTALQLDPHLEHIKLTSNFSRTSKPDASTLNVFDACAQVPYRYTPWQHITFNQKSYKKLIGMIVTFQEKHQNIKTRGFTFKNCGFMDGMEGNYAKFFDFLAKLRLESLGFDNFIHPEVDKYVFFDRLLVPTICEDLKYLRIGYEKGLDLAKLLHSTDDTANPLVLKNLVALSLPHNELEISDAIYDIMKTCVNLKALSLRGNHCMSATATTGQLPADIQYIDVSKSYFADNALLQFVRFVMKTKYTHGITLDLSELDSTVVDGKNVSVEELKRTCEYLCALKDSRLVGLNWSGTTIPKIFVKLLKRSPHLQSLYIDGCLGPLDAEFAEELAETIAKLPELKRLSIRGTDQYRLGAAIVPVIEKLKESESLIWLDVSNQHMGSDGVNAVKNLLPVMIDNLARANEGEENRDRCMKYPFVDFDDSRPENQDCITDIIAAAQEKNTEFHISFPVHDAQSLQMNLTNLIKDINQLSGEHLPEQTADDEFAQTFDTDVHEPDTYFPPFYSKAFAEMLYNGEEIDLNKDLQTPRARGLYEEEEDENDKKTDITEDDREREERQRRLKAFYLNEEEDDEDEEGVKRRDLQESSSDSENEEYHVYPYNPEDPSDDTDAEGQHLEWPEFPHKDDEKVLFPSEVERLEEEKNEKDEIARRDNIKGKKLDKKYVKECYQKQAEMPIKDVLAMTQKYFNNHDAIERLTKKYSTPVLRQNIQ